MFFSCRDEDTEDLEINILGAQVPEVLKKNPHLPKHIYSCCRRRVLATDPVAGPMLGRLVVSGRMKQDKG